MAVLGPQYCFEEDREFRVIEKVATLRTDSFDIADNKGNIAFKVKSSLVGVSNKLSLIDTSSGKEIATIRKKLVNLLGDCWVVEDTAGNEVASVKAAMISLTTSLKVKLVDGSELDVNGGFREKKFQVKRKATGTAVATVKKESKFSSVGAYLKSKMLDVQSYYVEVKAGEDAVLIVAIAIIIDEMAEEKAEAKKAACKV